MDVASPTPRVDDDRLRDRFGRPIDYLRISLIDTCNFRCVYCMPEDGLKFLKSDKLLRPEEIERVARAAIGVGFRKIRLTGGEPTLRPDVIEIVERLAALDGLRDLAMTTNGVRLVGLAAPLARAGLRRVNVHVDSLDPQTLPAIMRRGTLDAILAGIAAAEAAGLTPIKLNVVVARSYNDERDVIDLAALSLEKPWTVRFIELMPLGTREPAAVAIASFVSNEVTKARIEEALGPLLPEGSDHESDEAVNYRFEGAPGRVGFISPVSRPYCGTCNRLRLTADGRLHLCLLHDDEVNLAGAIRRGDSDEDLQRYLAAAVGLKPTGHALAEGVHVQGRQMFQLGG